MRRSLEIQGLRAVFILAVMLCHYVVPFRDMLLAGNRVEIALYHVANVCWSGVDFFFGISGFVVTALLLQKNDGYRAFMVRRARRLLPAYFTLLAAVAAFTVAGPLFGYAVRAGFALDSIWAWTLLANIPASVRGWQLGGGSVSLIHLWSLCVEMQFYLVWPLLVWKAKGRNLLIAMLALSAAAFLARCVLAHYLVFYSAIYSLTPLRIDAFAMGGVAAALAVGGRTWKSAPWIAAALLLPSYSWLLLDPTWHKAERIVQTLQLSVIAVGAAALVMAAYQQTLWRPLAAALRSRPLVYIGDRSYSLYLWHLPFMAVINDMVGATAPGNGRMWTVALVVVSNSVAGFILAEISYRLIEKRLGQAREYRSAAVAPALSGTA